MAIEIRNVSKSFGSTKALDNINVKFDEGGISGLFGNNGAGKTTLFNIIANRIYPSSGEVFVDGESVADNDHALGKIFMLCDANLYPDDMRVKRAFKSTSLFYKDFDLQYALELAERFGLKTNKKIASLSTGYASIFRIIIALSVNVPYLLLDEPVLGLDAQNRDLFYKLLLEKYGKHPCTIIISTHLIQEVSALIDQTVIIRNGNIIKNQSRDELLSSGYTVSGPAALVDEYTIGRPVISAQSLGGLKTACLSGKPEADDLPEGLEAGSFDLQEYFIQLMNGEGSK